MQTAIRRADERGRADHGWLESRHTFSFANYWDPRFMGFGALRVINEDRVRGGAGFPTHPHRDMEIISYVVRGGLEHRDTIGTGSVIEPGEVQVMSAGAGIAHSEYNASAKNPVHFLQIWIEPRTRGGEPTYGQKDFGSQPGLLLVVSPDGRRGSLAIKQDADLHRLLLPSGGSVTFAPTRQRVWIQVIGGDLLVDGTTLSAGDGLALVEPGELSLQAGSDVEALVFDLA